MAIFDLKNEYQRQDFIDYVMKLMDEAKRKDRCVVEIKKRHAQRTLSQNAYLHVLLAYFASQTGYSLEEVKVDWFKRHCNRELFEVEKVNAKGKKVKPLRSSAELTTAEMALAITRFRNFSLAEAEIYLPAANEDQFILHCEQEIEKYKEYE